MLRKHSTFESESSVAAGGAGVVVGAAVAVVGVVVAVGGDGGGGEGGVPRIFSSSQTPLIIGDVSTPLAVTVWMDECPSKPPRGWPSVLTLIKESGLGKSDFSTGKW